jgi:hypothetical protein
MKHFLSEEDSPVRQGAGVLNLAMFLGVARQLLERTDSLDRTSFCFGRAEAHDADEHLVDVFQTAGDVLVQTAALFVR